MTARTVGLIASGALITAACGPRRAEHAREPDVVRVEGAAVAVVDTTIDAVLEISGVAQPYQQATLSTKLNGTVMAVLVHEGDVVSAGQPLVRIDARDVSAKEAQIAATVAEAEAGQRDAVTQATRMRALYVDSAATRAQLDAAETGLARAEAAVRAARAAAVEIGTVKDYAVVRAPFAGVITRRLVDPGAFAAPGAPLVAVQDVGRIRIVATATPESARLLRRGASIGAIIDGRGVNAVIEGVVPATTGNMATVNAIVVNSSGAFLSGSTASLLVPAGRRQALLIPQTAVRREGDLTGVMVRTSGGDQLRWIRIGHVGAGTAEVTAGLRAGDRVVVPNVVPVSPGRN